MLSAMTLSLHTNERQSNLNKENLLEGYQGAERIARIEWDGTKTIPTFTKRQAQKPSRASPVPGLDIRYWRNGQEQPAEGWATGLWLLHFGACTPYPTHFVFF